MSNPANTALWGSSSWAMGAPKKARMASPISRARVPSYRYIGEIRCSNAPFMISAHSSGSSLSAADVEPVTSQNSMVTTRRSPETTPLVRAPSSLASSSLGMYCSSLARELSASEAEAVAATGGVCTDTLPAAG